MYAVRCVMVITSSWLKVNKWLAGGPANNLLARTVAGGFRILLCGVTAVHCTLGTGLGVARLVLIVAVSGFVMVLRCCFVIAGSFFVQSAGFIGMWHGVFS